MSRIIFIVVCILASLQSVGQGVEHEVTYTYENNHQKFTINGDDIEWMWEPYGKLLGVSDIMAKFKNAKIKTFKDDDVSVILVKPNETDEILYGRLQGSRTYPYLDVVYADVKESNVVMQNGIAIGDSKCQIRRVLFIQQELDDYVELVSGLDGLFIHMYFKDNKLYYYKIRTDLTLESNKALDE